MRSSSLEIHGNAQLLGGSFVYEIADMIINSICTFNDKFLQYKIQIWYVQHLQGQSKTSL